MRTAGNVALVADTDNNGTGEITAVACARSAAAAVTASAATGIDLDTAAQTLTANTTGGRGRARRAGRRHAGPPHRERADHRHHERRHHRHERRVANGPDANDVNITVFGGDLTLAALDAGPARDVTLNANGGRILDDDAATEVRCQVLVLLATGGVGLGAMRPAGSTPASRLWPDRPAGWCGPCSSQAKPTGSRSTTLSLPTALSSFTPWARSPRPS